MNTNEGTYFNKSGWRREYEPNFFTSTNTLYLFSVRQRKSAHYIRYMSVRECSQSFVICQIDLRLSGLVPENFQRREINHPR